MPGDAQGQDRIDADVVRIRNIGRRFREKTIWISAVDIPRGKVVAIVGASGSGKSTFLHIVGGLSRPDFQQDSNSAGVLTPPPMVEVIFALDDCKVHYDLCKGVPRDFQQRIGFVFQSPYLLQAATASANIALGAFSARRSICPTTVKQIAENLEIDSFLSDRSNARSGGERQRIALARAFARNPNLILADEPTANLDPKLAEEIIGSLGEWSNRAADRTTIWVTHDVRLAAEYADTVVVLNNGRLAEWTTWPQGNPRDPSILRKWIDGQPATGRPVSIFAGSVTGATNAKIHKFKSMPAKTTNTRQRIHFWMKIGLAQVFDGPSADSVRFLRRWTSVATPQACNARPRAKDESRIATVLQLWESFGAKASVLRLALFLAVMVALWAELDRLNENIRESLLAPTINPIVISSKAIIDDRAVKEARQRLAIQHEDVIDLPDAFGRYEFGRRNVSILRDGSDLTAPRDYCSTIQNRGDKEVLMEIAAIDPGEPLLKRLAIKSRPDTPTNRPDFSDRFDGLWSIWLSHRAHQSLVGILGAPSDIRFICMQVGGFWVTAEVLGMMSEIARGRFGPYDIIMSGTQWRDFGPSRDRDYYQSVAMYFDADPERSQNLVERVRARASEMFDPPNTRLVQSLANEAAFERIAAALERNVLSKIIVGFLGSASLFVLVLVVYGFVSENFQSNLKSICVALTLGVGFFEIAIIQMTRTALVVAPTAILAGLAILPFGEYQLSHANPASQTIWTLSSLLTRLGLAFCIFFAGILVLVLMVSGWWLIHIKRRSLTDQLKELD